MALKGDVSTSHHLLRSQLCCLEADYVMLRDKSLLPLHQAFFLGGWPGGPFCIWEAPSFQAMPNHKCVKAGYTLAPNKSSINCAAGTEVPISTDPATRLCFQGLLITGTYVWPLLPNHHWSGQTPARRDHCSWCTFSNFFTFPFPAAVNIRGFLERDATAWECGLKDTSLPALGALLHVRMFEHLSGESHSTYHAHPQPAPPSSPVCTPSATPSAMPG